MKRYGFKIAWLTGLSVLLALVLFACKGPAVPEPAAVVSPTGTLPSLPADAAATLSSLERVDEYPLYVMHYSGSYQDYLNAPASPSGFSCSLFAAVGDPESRLYGRNFDWDFSPALLLFTDPPDGYASVSMVDLTFLDINPDTARTLTDLPLAERMALLSAPSMPFDGMNEYGLVVGMAAVGGSLAGDDPARATIGSIGVIREILDHARNVDEALAVFAQYNIDFRGGPAIHYLLADAGGRAALVEFVNGEMRVLPNTNPWHLATNFLCSTTESDGGCWRYPILRERLSESDGILDPAAAMQLLADVSQPGGTQWSVLYDLSTGSVRVVMGREYSTVHRFNLEMARP
jgi:hypothetical protein